MLNHQLIVELHITIIISTPCSQVNTKVRCMANHMKNNKLPLILIEHVQVQASELMNINTQTQDTKISRTNFQPVVGCPTANLIPLNIAIRQEYKAVTRKTETLSRLLPNREI